MAPEVVLNEITGGVFSPKMTMPYNKLLTNLACSSRTGEYWPSVVFVRTSLRSVRTVTTSGQYSPVRPSRSVSKRLVKIIVTMVTQNHQIISSQELHKMAERFSLDFEIRRFKNLKENSENQNTAKVR